MIHRIKNNTVTFCNLNMNFTSQAAVNIHPHTIQVSVKNVTIGGVGWGALAE